MRRKITRLTLVATLLLVAGCASVPVERPQFCTDKASYIYDLADTLHINPRSVSNMLVIANYEAIRFAPLYTEEACRGAIKNVRLALSAGTPTYYEIMALVSSNVDYVNKYAGKEIMMLGLFIPQLTYKVPITDCDRLCILWHLDQQEAMLNSLFGKKTDG